jgi:RNA polymerase sigma factor (sigma-70 family)
VAAVPSIGRAARVERPVVPSADAATTLYEKYSGQILGYCLHQLGSREEAEDAVQTTFMNAFRGLKRGVVPEVESAWLFKIAHNVCLSRRRSSWRRGRVEAPNNFEVLQEIVPGREQVVADELIRLQDVLEEMPENQRRAILLREWQGLTYREISTELGLSQAAVETLIFRARRALAQGLEQDADTWKRRLRRGADAGGAVAIIQALISGGGAAALKVGATVIAVATAGLAANNVSTPEPGAHRAMSAPAKSAPAPKPTAPQIRSFAASTAAASAPVARLAAKPQQAPAVEEQRRLPSPVAVSAENTEAAAASPPPPAPADTTLSPLSPAAESKPEPSPAPAPALAARQAPDDKGKNDKSQRQPQLTPQPEPPPVPAAPPSESPPEHEPTPPGHEDRSDKQDHSNKPDNPGKPDKPDPGNGKK